MLFLEKTFKKMRITFVYNDDPKLKNIKNIYIKKGHVKSDFQKKTIK